MFVCDGAVVCDLFCATGDLFGELLYVTNDLFCVRLTFTLESTAKYDILFLIISWKRNYKIVMHGT